MNERKRKRIERRTKRLETKMEKDVEYQEYLSLYELSRRYGPTDEMMDAITRALEAQGFRPMEPTKKAPTPKGRIPWYDQAIKKCYSWIEKICKNQGYYGDDLLKRVEAPVPDEIKDYLEDEEINFKLRDKDDLSK